MTYIAAWKARPRLSRSRSRDEVVDIVDRPNILFSQVDNLGLGELTCDSGGRFREATTRRIDDFAGH